MKPEIAQLLYDKYPVIFFGRSDSTKKSVVAHYGLEIGDGWFNIIDILCNQLYSNYQSAKYEYERFLKYQLSSDAFDQLQIQKNLNPHDNNLKYTLAYSPIEVEKARLIMMKAYYSIPVAHQIKEKFGTLRFYLDKDTPLTHILIEMAESFSAVTCETCGDKGSRTSSKGGWIKTLCAKHSQE